MEINRREFLTRMTGGGAAGAAGVAVFGVGETADAQLFRREPKQMPPDALGLLYDSTLCIGCRACQAACKEANGMTPEIPPQFAEWNQGTWDSPTDLSGDTLTVIQVYQNGTMEAKDRETDGFAFIKHQCMHCTDASCISVCPVTAMTKDSETGVVLHHPDRCIGCRYCVLACPFGVPRYEFDDPFGQIQKCQLCANVEGRDVPACADVCPTGATLFGRTADLQAEAQRRLGKQPGESYWFPRGEFGGDQPPHEGTIPVYHDDIYGDAILGGTQVRVLSGVPIELLGLPSDVPDYSYATITEGIQHTVYKYFIAPFVLLAGLAWFAYRNARHHKEEDWD